MHELQINIDTIGDGGLVLERETNAAFLALSDRFGPDDRVDFVSPIRVRLHATLSGKTVILSGRIITGVKLTCSRCLGSFTFGINSEFSTTAVPTGDITADTTESSGDVELDAAEMELITYEGNIIDFREEAAQQIILALPFNPICQAGCKGICSGCGANLNETACTCKAQAGANPFAALKKLTFPDGEG